eukprot:COSAG04_NODE_10504_length_772_cov_1.496285_1_plen_40_part_10
MVCRGRRAGVHGVALLLSLSLTHGRGNTRRLHRGRAIGIE